MWGRGWEDRMEARAVGTEGGTRVYKQVPWKDLAKGAEDGEGGGGRFMRVTSAKRMNGSAAEVSAIAIADARSVLRLAREGHKECINFDNTSPSLWPWAASRRGAGRPDRERRLG